MDSLPRLLIEVYDKTLTYQATVAAPTEATFTMRHNAIGSGSLTLDADLPAVAALASPGARVWVRYRYDPSDLSRLMHVISGPVSEVAGDATVAPERTFSVLDDLDLIWNRMECRPLPGSALSAQGSGTYYQATGPVESVIKGLVTANKAALGIGSSITVESTSGRGETVSALMRFETIADKLANALQYGHMGFRLRQTDAGGLRFEAYQPQTLTLPLSVESGVLASASFTLARPTGTRVTVRGGTEDTPIFRERIATATEALYGDCGRLPLVEVDGVTDTSVLDAKGDEALGTAARTAGLQVELAETDVWRVGVAVSLGDDVSIQIAGVGVLTDTLTEVELALTASNSLVVTPRIGDHSGPNELLARGLQSVAGQVRNIKARG